VPDPRAYDPPVDSEYREPSWRGVIITLVVTLVVIAALVLIASYLLQQACPPGQLGCGVPSAPPPGN
jgi:hypothetical protein